MPGKAAPKKNLSALKRVRQAEKRELRNKSVKTAIKTATKKVIAAVEEKDREKIQKELIEATKLISRAAAKGIIHKNTASRKISRLAIIANKVLRAEAA